LVDGLPRGLEVAELDVEGSEPVRCHAVGDFPDRSLLDGERHLACSLVRRAVGAEDGLVDFCGFVVLLWTVGGVNVKRVEDPMGPG